MANLLLIVPLMSTAIMIIGVTLRIQSVRWLAERMMERETASAPVPAYQSHRDWLARR
jgi:hypothetical protein